MVLLKGLLMVMVIETVEVVVREMVLVLMTV